MNLIIDIGNTNAKMLAYDNGKPLEEACCSNNDFSKIALFCKRFTFNRGIYSTVVDLDANMQKAIDSLPFPMMKLTDTTPVPIKNLYSTPKTLGTDRLAAVVGAAYKQPGRDILVIDLGTCVTYDFINAKAEYLGGNISPGPDIRFHALNAYTCRLPLIDTDGDVPEVGYDTETAIRSGIIKGIEYEINGYIDSFTTKYPQLLVYLTGGARLNLHNSKKSSIFADKFIVPDGLNRILDYNHESV